MTTIQVSIPIFSMSRNILAMSEFTSRGRHIGFQDGRQMFYITLYLTYYCTLEGKEKLFTPRKMFTIWKLSSYDRHIRIQDGHHIITHAVFHADICRLPCKLSLRKFLYHHFDQMAAIFNFPMRAALPVVFSVIEHINMHIHVS